jgi:hypothetical protein
VSPGRLVGGVVALAMLLGGGFLFAAGNGWLGAGSQSTVWAVAGGVLAGLGVALAVSMVQHARQQAQLSELDRNRYGGRR